MDVEIPWEECVDDIPLDTKTLPPLDALSSNNARLPDIDLLDLFSLDHQTTASSPHHQHRSPSSPPPRPKPSLPANLTDSPVTSASPAPSSPGSSSTQSGRDSNCSHPSDSKQFSELNISTATDKSSADSNPPLTDQAQLVLELSTRLASAGAEATRLRKRVASLAAENRSLRGALDHANARLLAVAQAATATTHPASTQPMMLGLAHVTTDVANRLTGALTVSDPRAANGVAAAHTNADFCGNSVDSHHCATQPASQQRSSKKRKRMTGAAATTMACVMFMWGALIGSPGWLSASGNSSSRTQGALPAIWSGSEGQAHTGLASVNGNARAPHERELESWQPNCMRVLAPLPDGKGSAAEQTHEPLVVVGNKMNNEREGSAGHRVENEMFVDVMDHEATAKSVATADHYSDKLPKYSYVLCRDTQTAMNNVKACTKRMKDGLPCGQPHTISLILPAGAAGLDELETNETDGAGEQAGRLDLAEVQCSITSVARIPASAVGEGANVKGRVVATVAETGTVVVG